MISINELKQKVINGHSVTRSEANELITADLSELCSSANEIRAFFNGNSFDVCSIINGKSGKCSENCKYCAQSSFYNSSSEEYPLLNTEQLLKQAQHDCQGGVLRYSVVTSGKSLDDNEVDRIKKSFEEISRHCPISLCASHGLLSLEQLIRLKKSGVTRYHNNLETSRRMFPNICTTHTYDDKIDTIKAAKKAGLEVCSGGIIGLGEKMKDRLDMAFDLRELDVNSVPINILTPIKGTPFEKLPTLSIEEVCRIVAIFKFILPKTAIRLAGGRGLLPDKGSSVFKSGANAVISGDMLTTAGISIADDMKIIKGLGFEVKKID